jgi:hypothetical protein
MFAPLRGQGDQLRYFEALPSLIRIPGTTAELAPNNQDARWRSGEVRILYTARHLGDFANLLRPFVLLEIGKRTRDAFRTARHAVLRTRTSLRQRALGQLR